MRSLLQSLRSYIRYRMSTTKQSRDQVDESQQLIEVFDVLLRSKQRLQLFDLATQQDLLLNEQKCSYLKAMEIRFEDGTEAQDDEPNQQEMDSVYLLDEDPGQSTSQRKAWDLRLDDGNDFEQLHLIRFEVDKTRRRALHDGEKRSSDKLMKITDIDLWMAGNRHCIVLKE